MQELKTLWRRSKERCRRRRKRREGYPFLTGKEMTYQPKMRKLVMNVIKRNESPFRQRAAAEFGCLYFEALRIWRIRRWDKGHNRVIAKRKSKVIEEEERKRERGVISKNGNTTLNSRERKWKTRTLWQRMDFFFHHDLFHIWYRYCTRWYVCVEIKYESSVYFICIA